MPAQAQPAIPKPSHPSPDRRRFRWLNLNGEWEFSFDRPVFDRRIVVPFSWAAPLSGIAEDRKGVAYYRRTLVYQPVEDRLFLIFGAVDYDCEVWINDQPAGAHRGGYARFELDVTPYWRREGGNTIVIKATDDDLPHQTYGKQGYGNCRGIWQTVWLEERPALYLDHFTIRTLIDGTVTIDCELAGEGELLDITASFGAYQAAAANGRISLKISEPQLWTPDSPHLYEGSLTVASRLGDRPAIDCVQTYFGIREVGTARCDADGHPYITLNRQPVYLNGTLDQSFNPQGFFTLPSDEEAAEEIRRMKRIGLNLARIHIKPEEPLKLYYADKLGLLIMADLPCWWGEPNDQARSLFEAQMTEHVRRDINHPAIIYWVVFNETWGLLHKITRPDGTTTSVYQPETQDWVRQCYRRVKQLDPTRLVEDNSPCRNDHVETDVNTWHFYANGYTKVKQVIDDFTAGAYSGSTANFIGGNTCGDVPAINSECGNVWGIQGSAGDSDISWHYKYMLNEFRLHDRLGGFIFTEFHDVVNEFNGYYRIDNSAKHFGYGGLVPGMSLTDLHAADFLAYDAPPMSTVLPGETRYVPLFVSSFSTARHNRPMLVRWELALTDRTGQTAITSQGELSIRYNRFGRTKLADLPVTMPPRQGVAILRLYLVTGDGQILMRNFVQYDVRTDDPAAGPAESLSLEPSLGSGDGFRRTWLVQGGSKLNSIGNGSVRFMVNKQDIPGLSPDTAIEVRFEASARAPMSKDLPDATAVRQSEGSYMLGYRVDRGANPNSFFMTDDSCEASELTLEAEDFRIGEFRLPDCPADSRGCLSWHCQAADDRLDEAGSYGYFCRAAIPAAIVRQLPERFSLTFRATQGLSLFGRRSGRYPVAVDLAVRKP